MWDNDVIWLDDVLRGGSVSMRFYFTPENKLDHHEPLT